MSTLSKVVLVSLVDSKEVRVDRDAAMCSRIVNDALGDVDQEDDDNYKVSLKDVRNYLSCFFYKLFSILLT